MQFGWNFLFSRFYQEIKKLIWYFNYNIMILICQIWMKFCKQFIYFIFTHTYIYYVDFLEECLFFIWVYLDRIYSSAPPNSRFLAPPLVVLTKAMPKHSLFFTKILKLAEWAPMPLLGTLLSSTFLCFFYLQLHIQFLMCIY